MSEYKKRTYRPVLDDDDMALIIEGMEHSIKHALDDAEGGPPEQAADAIRFRKEANALLSRFRRMGMEAIKRSFGEAAKSVVEGQLTLDEALSGLFEGAGIKVRPMSEAPREVQDALQSAFDQMKAEAEAEDEGDDKVAEFMDSVMPVH